MRPYDAVPLESIILVGGKGTRLQNVINDRPKPMADVAGRPFLEWVLKSLKKQGVRKVILCTGYLGDFIEDYFGDGKNLDLELHYSQDPIPLGTAGAVRHATELIKKDRFLVLNGDSYCRFDLQQLAISHMRKKALITMWLVNVDDCRRFGSIQIGKDGAIQAFWEKQPVQRSGLINAGIYLMERNITDAIEEKKESSLESEVFPEYIGHGLYGIVGEGPFLDIGTPEAFAIAGEFILREFE